MLKLPAVSFAPSHWVDIHTLRLTPVVTVIGPPIKMDQQLALFYFSNGGYTYQGGVLAVFGL